ncbi:hypothetical protein [Leptolyngbya sp. BC1307]|uniref:hypothetical protein n=1 Tax=Leptolyngbya sp. BC1307 TaxID=2029589 RepID=UPI000EFA982C|nr:hypothetical protein [Leptolyngbya sp. BC1307]
MRVFLAALAVVAAAVGAGIGYAGMKTTALPDWYSKGEEPLVVSSTESAAFADPNDVVISAGELNRMVTDAIASQPAAAPILNAARGVNTSIEDGRIESGMVMNLSEIPLEALPTEGRQAVEQLTHTFPFLANREVYLGVEGSPAVVDGALSLNDTHIKVGQLSLPIASVAKQLGLSQAEIEQQLDAVLAQQGLTPDDVKIVDGQLVIRGVAQ